MKSKFPIIWNGDVVGTVENLHIDNFDVYGKWEAFHIPATELFLASLRAGEQLEVQIGTETPHLFGTVEFEPDSEIEIKRRSHKT